MATIPSESPNILVKEIDLTGSVPAVTSSIGAFVGEFNWGPTNSAILIGNEERLAETFGSPALSTISSVDFLTAAYFLKYTDGCYVVRGLGASAKNAIAGGATGEVIEVTIAGTNNNYTDTPTITFTGGGGSGAVAAARMEIKTISAVNAAGSSYAVNDVFEIDLGTGTNATGRVTTIGTSGAVTGVELLSGGSFEGTLASLTGTATLNTSGGGDNALTVDLTVGVKEIIITDGGSGYTGTPTVVDSEGGNATLTAVTGGSSASVLIENREDWLTDEPSVGDFHAKWPGALGDSLSVHVCNSAAFTGWAYESSFDEAPGTSSWASDLGGSGDELHLVVVDEDGEFTGEPGRVLEAFAFISAAAGAKGADGQTNYAKDVINNQSEYIWLRTISDITSFGGAGSTTFGDIANTSYSLTGGVNGTYDTSSVQGGYDEFNDGETIQIDFLIAPGQANNTDLDTVVDDLVAIAEGPSRKDCVVVTSPARDDVVGVANPATAAANVKTSTSGFNRSNYLIVDNNWFQVYDKYKDEYVYIPASSSTAGLMAATDRVAAPWFSPAGQRRGRYLGVTRLATNAEKTDRDLLYKHGVNPISNIPGQGVLLYGDKTFQSRPSAFDRINVRRLFLTVERAIKAASQNVLFEFNDEFTRAEFVNVVEPFLREVQGRRGITDFRVVCDETNNTASVIDSNRFVASIFIKPARSINYITLNFVAVRTGVEFEEIVGTV
jgi:hypothetical protein